MTTILPTFTITAGNGETFTFALAEFLREGEVYLTNEELVARAKELGGMTDVISARALFEHQAEIPEEWRNYILVFPGTTRRDRGDLVAVPCLIWRAGEDFFLGQWGQWWEGPHWPELHAWAGNDRIVRLLPASA